MKMQKLYRRHVKTGLTETIGLIKSWSQMKNAVRSLERGGYLQEDDKTDVWISQDSETMYWFVEVDESEVVREPA